MYIYIYMYPCIAMCWLSTRHIPTSASWCRAAISHWGHAPALRANWQPGLGRELVISNDPWWGRAWRAWTCDTVHVDIVHVETDWNSESEKRFVLFPVWFICVFRPKHSMLKPKRGSFFIKLAWTSEGNGSAFLPKSKCHVKLWLSYILRTTKMDRQSFWRKLTWKHMGGTNLNYWGILGSLVKIGPKIANMDKYVGNVFFFASLLC